MEQFFKNHKVLSISLLVAWAGLGTFYLKNKSTGPMCRKVVDLIGKVIIVTGGNKGIGKEVVRALAKMNARVIIACRDKITAEETINEIKKEKPSAQLEFMQLDLSKTESILSFANAFKEKYLQLHTIINNAGVINYERIETNGQENTIFTNYLGPFLLTYLLLDILRKSSPSKIINVSSNYHHMANYNFDDFTFQKSWNSLYAYKVSKLYQVMMTRQMHKYYFQDRIHSYSCTPGLVRTDILWNRPWYSKFWLLLFYPYFFLVGRTPENGAQTIIHLAIEPDRNLESGEYYRDMKIFQMSKLALSEENNQKLWELSKDIMKLN